MSSRNNEYEKTKADLEKYNTSWESGILTQKQLLSLEQKIDDAQTQLSKLSMAAGDAPIISVVLSVYNTEKYIAAALESILDQTFKNFEVLLIDDGSSDGSIAIAKSYNDPRVRIIHQTNHGLVYSFNKGVRLARGEFIARMDADDICLPSRFEKELTWLLASPNRGLVGTFFRYIDQETAKPLDVIQTSPLKHIDIARMMYIVNPFGHGSVMYRKEAFTKVGGYRSEYEPSEDYDLWRRLALSYEVGQIPEVLYLWRFQTTGLGNISQRKRKQSNDSAAHTVKNMWDGPLLSKSIRDIVADGRELKAKATTLSPQLYNQYMDHQFRLAISFCEHGYRRTSLKTAIGATRLEPKIAYNRVWKVLPKILFKKPNARSAS